MRVLYCCGVVPSWPEPLRPLPPLDSGAPHGNIFRLAEEIGRAQAKTGIELEVASPVDTVRVRLLDDTYRHRELAARYRQVRVPAGVRRFGDLAARACVPEVALRRVTRAPSVQGWWYLRGLGRLAWQLEPDVVVLDDGPQFIPGVRRFLRPSRFVFLCRGHMGESRRHLHLPDRLVATNPELADWLRSIDDRVRQVDVVPNSLPPDYEGLEPDPDKFLRRPRRVAFVGRLVEGKGLEWLIRALAPLMATCDDLQLDIVGDASPSGSGSADSRYRERVRALAGELLPAARVTWHGWLPTRGVVELLRGAWLAVFPSTLVEGFGMVALEAMACGTPVVASNRPGFSWLLRNGGGMLVDEPAEVEALTAAMGKILLDPGLARRLAAEGRREAAGYTASAAAGRLVEALGRAFGPLRAVAGPGREARASAEGGT